MTAGSDIANGLASSLTETASVSLRRASRPAASDRRARRRCGRDALARIVNHVVKYRRAGGESQAELVETSFTYFASAAWISLTASSLAHSAGPAMVPISQPCGSISSVVGMPKARPIAFKSWNVLAVGIGVIGELLDADFLQPGFRLVGIAGVDIDRHHLEIRAAEPLLQRIERRHFLAAGHAPGGPQIEQHRAAAPIARASAACRRRRGRQGRAPGAGSWRR